MPKEVRNPKVDARRDSAPERAFDAASAWLEVADSVLVLRDGDDRTDYPDLIERTARFGERVIRFTKKVPRGAGHPENARLVDQLVGSATAVGANYCEADDAVSGKDFRNKIGYCRKESKEAMFFLRMIAASEEALAGEARKLWREAKELNLIFGAIWRKL